MKLIALIMVSLLFLGCITPPKSGLVPSDLEIKYSYGACHAEWGRTTITIDADGNGIYQSGSGMMLDNGRFENEGFRKTFTLNESEILELLDKIESSGFYSLDEHYSDPMVMDGSCKSIFITKNNFTKSVSVVNTNAPEAYSTVADAIIGIVESKTN
ncbi:MAG: hypothetical protein ABID61_03990 [Candidatus Micrarchaeota archaeon]